MIFENEKKNNDEFSLLKIRNLTLNVICFYESCYEKSIL